MTAALAIPPLWQPRSGPWWRRPWRAPLASFGRIFTTNGLTFNTSSGIKVGTTCATCGCAVACSSCSPSATPSKWTCTWAGVTPCACDVCGGGASAIYTSIPDGTVCLSQDPASSCRWFYCEKPSSITADIFSGPSCGGSPTTFNVFLAILELSGTTGTLKLGVNAPGSSCPTTTPSSAWNFFRKDFTLTAGKCADSYTLANEGDCGFSAECFDSVIGTGGTAVITPGC